MGIIFTVIGWYAALFIGVVFLMIAGKIINYIVDKNIASKEKNAKKIENSCLPSINEYRSARADGREFLW